MLIIMAGLTAATGEITEFYNKDLSGCENSGGNNVFRGECIMNCTPINRDNFAHRGCPIKQLNKLDMSRQRLEL